MASAEFHFPRRRQAEAIMAGLKGEGLADYGSGLFLAAPRRTGKSTFLRRDLLPVMEKDDVLPIYVDLWSDRDKDPADLLAAAIRRAIADNGRPAAKLARNMGLTKVGVGSFISFDLDRIGKPDGVTLSDALRHLRAVTGRRIALIVDEAQHALSSEAGVSAMFGLKAARDAMNQVPDGENARGLLLVFTGSHRDKLANLVMRRDQPFFGAAITSFPLLGRDFADALTAWTNTRLSAASRIDPDVVHDAFKLLGHRPELIRQAIATAALNPAETGTVNDLLSIEARRLREGMLEALRQELAGLTPVQAAVLRSVAADGSLAPFSAKALKGYAELAGKPVEVTDAQGALDALRKKGLIWKSDRSVYLLEDPVISDLMRERDQPEANADPDRSATDAMQNGKGPG
jgi:hypothetical protein